VSNQEAAGQGDARPIRLILDASAIVAFTRASIHVGEVLAEVHDEDAVAALPVACLVEVVHAVADTDRLDLLVAHQAIVILPDDAASWQVLAATYDITGRYDAAAAGLAALDYDVAVLSRQPGLYAGLDAGGLVVSIED